MSKTAVIIPASGAGVRMGRKTAKPYLLLDSLPILVHTLRIFEKSPLIDAILPVVRDHDRTYVRDNIIEPFGFTKITGIIAGGEMRQDSIRNALPFLAHDHSLIIVHDGVRPLLEHHLLEQVIEAARHAGAAVPGVPVKDTCKTADTDFFVQQTINRRGLYQIQTPQVFKKEILLAAYEEAYQKGFYGTDDASLVERLGLPVKVVVGSYENIKITTPDDLLQAEFIARRRKAKEDFLMKIGFGYDSHRFTDNRPLILGGILIPAEKGLAGHSDADVLTHAIGDAILGALGEDDIGCHFPDTDPAYKNISSLILLEKIKNIMTERDYAITNIDASLVVEAPKIRPFASAIKDRLAQTLNITPEQINIKAKTNEGMGFIGRKEGMAAFATVLLERKK